MLVTSDLPHFSDFLQHHKPARGVHFFSAKLLPVPRQNLSFGISM